MPFRARWSNRVHKQVVKILEELGYQTFRADDLYGHNVLEDIWRAINDGFAELSRQLPGYVR